MTNQITVKAMLSQMESGDPFSITFVTFDRQRKKGGKVHTYGEAVLVLTTKVAKKASEVDRAPTSIERKKAKLETLKRAPNHHKWYTRNIQLLVNGHPTGERRKIHPPLVITFNNKIVVA